EPYVQVVLGDMKSKAQKVIGLDVAISQSTLGAASGRRKIIVDPERHRRTEAPRRDHGHRVRREERRGRVVPVRGSESGWLWACISHVARLAERDRHDRQFSGVDRVRELL